MIIVLDLVGLLLLLLLRSRIIFIGAEGTGKEWKGQERNGTERSGKDRKGFRMNWDLFSGVVVFGALLYVGFRLVSGLFHRG